MMAQPKPRHGDVEPAFMRGLRGRLLRDEPLAAHTSWRVGGAAEFLFTPADRDDLLRLLAQLPAAMPVCWLGLGSNLLVRDGGVAGLVVRTAKGLRAMRLGANGRGTVEAGVSCAKVARAAAAAGLSGAEFLAGVPGTFGGALAMNAGAFGGETWDFVAAVEVAGRDGRVRNLPADDIEVAYRQVDLPAECGILSARIVLRPGDGGDGKKRIVSLMTKRGASQPVTSASAGSVFRNPPGAHAARLIEAAGLKGAREGDAEVSGTHANFIINRGRATSADIERLILRVQREVQAQSGVKLQPEVRIIGRAA